MVRISFTGDRGAGKTVLAKAIQSLLSSVNVQSHLSRERDDDTLHIDNDFDPAAFSAQQSRTVKHAEMVTTLVKPGADIRASMTPEMADLLHAAVGISGEAGELLDGVKKHVIYNKPLDRENIIEELGDLEFYMEQLRQRIGVTRDETLAANIAKLSVRYEGLRYSDAAAQNRADKA